MYYLNFTCECMAIGVIPHDTHKTPESDWTATNFEYRPDYNNFRGFQCRRLDTSLWHGNREAIGPFAIPHDIVKFNLLKGRGV